MFGEGIYCATELQYNSSLLLFLTMCLFRYNLSGEYTYYAIVVAMESRFKVAYAAQSLGQQR